MHYLTPSQALAAHYERCAECQTNAFGFCAAGYRLLGEISGMRKEDGQLELLPKEVMERPMTRTFWQDKTKNRK